MARRPSANRLRTRKRREHARQRIQAGAELTPDERLQITKLLSQLGRDALGVTDDLAAIEYSVAHYWYVWHLMPDTGDDNRRKSNAPTKPAVRRRVQPSLGRPREGELRWLLTGLAAIWTRRLGKPFEPRKTKRDNLWDFAQRVVKIADPHVTPANITSILRKIKLIESRLTQRETEDARKIGGKK
jgi:hypothetical protein